MMKPYSILKGEDVKSNPWRYVHPIIRVRHLIEYSLMPIFRRRPFTYMGKKYDYFYHGYGATWLNERKIEVPIFESYVAEAKGNILEVGNTLQNYVEIKHPHFKIIDKFEKGEGVRNIDILDLPIEEKYDLIISISSLEHIGRRPDNFDPYKIAKVLKVLVEALNPGGKLVFSYCTGESPMMEMFLDLNKERWNVVTHSFKTSNHFPVGRKYKRTVCVTTITKD